MSDTGSRVRSEVEVTDAADVRGRRVALVGKLAGMTRREAQSKLREHGAIVVDAVNDSVEWIVVGEDGLPLGEWLDAVDESLKQAIDQGRLSVLRETELWQRLGLLDDARQVQRRYTPAMLAELLRVPVSVIRRWQRRGLIRPAQQINRLPYFDFQEVASARRLAQLLAEGVTPAQLERQLAQLRRWLPELDHSLAQLSIIVQGQRLLLRQDAGLVEPSGQRQFDFDRLDEHAALDELPPPEPLPLEADALSDLAAQREEEGDISGAIALCRAALVAGGPQAETCFQLAELLYRQGDIAAARERYFMAIELDENYVEARANLGCVLAEQGSHELAIAAFQGALEHHADYADVHYHLARSLDELGRRAEAEVHLRAFLELAPDTPWADLARERLAIAPRR